MNSPTTTTMTPMNNLAAQLGQVGLRALPANLDDFVARATKGRWSPRMLLEQLAQAETAHEESRLAATCEGRQPQRILRISRMAMQTVDFGRHGQPVTDGGVDLRLLRHADQGARTLGCVTFLGEGVDISMTAALIFWIPDTGAKFEPQV
jgi:hypothetical protein